MSAIGQVGLLRNPGDVGTGWTGVTDDDKRNAGGKAPDGADAEVRLRFAGSNANLVARLHGSGYWTSQARRWIS